MATLTELERKYDGPIPKDELDAALGREIASVRQARHDVTFWARQLEDAHKARARFLDDDGDGYSEEAWADWDRRTTRNISQARNNHEKALVWLAKLTTPRAAE